FRPIVKPSEVTVHSRSKCPDLSVGINGCGMLNATSSLVLSEEVRLTRGRVHRISLLFMLHSPHDTLPNCPEHALQFTVLRCRNLPLDGIGKSVQLVFALNLLNNELNKSIHVTLD